MLNKEELIAEISNIDYQISKLEQKKTAFVKNLLECNNLTLKERFIHWSSNCEKEHPWYLQEHTWPIAYSILDNRELNRHQTYNVRDLFEEELYPVIGDEMYVKGMIERGEITQEEIQKATALAEELIKGNCITFTYDW